MTLPTRLRRTSPRKTVTPPVSALRPARGPITLSCTIPGLSLEGVAVRKVGAETGCMYRVIGYMRRWLRCIPAPNGGTDTVRPPEDWVLDLSDPVSRVAAAWWVCGQGGGITEDEQVILAMAKGGVHINTLGQEKLRDMVLRRVKASPSPDKQPGADGIPLDQEKR